MSAARLSGRLARIREAKSRCAPGGTDGPGGKSLSGALTAESALGQHPAIRGWSQTAPFLYERTTSIPVSGFRKRFSVHLPLLFPAERAALGTEGLVDTAPLVFFDLETTGLSRGAGTVAFMAGVARFGEEGVLHIDQLLISDFPGEVVFLERLSALVGEKPVLVSFNGKCFDSQVLFNRFLMNGIRPSFLAPGTPHLDLLFPSRRLWKTETGSCRLSALEGRILGINRVDDLPGSEAPDAWFSFLREGEQERLLAVGDHNRDDCFALARLLFALDDAMEEGTGRAALIRSLDLRKRGEYAQAARILRPLAETGDRTACRILAVDCEHRLGDLDRALCLAEAIGDGHRAERIRAKRERRSRE